MCDQGEKEILSLISKRIKISILDVGETGALAVLDPDSTRSSTTVRAEGFKSGDML